MSQITRSLLGTGAAPIETLTGDAGGAVAPDGVGNIDFTGTDPITVTGTPAANSLDITIAASSEIQVGAIRLATAAETTAGISTTLSIHPTDLNTKIGPQTANGLIYGQGGAGTNLASLAEATNGQIPIGSTGNAPVLNTITAGPGIVIANTPGVITVSSAGACVWNEILAVGPTVMAVDNGYIANNAGLVTLTLPAVAVVGDTVRVTGKGAGLFRIAQNAGQTIYFGNQTTTPGVGGRLDSNHQRDSIELVCITANTEFNCISSVGNITVA